MSAKVGDDGHATTLAPFILRHLRYLKSHRLRVFSIDLVPFAGEIRGHLIGLEMLATTACPTVTVFRADTEMKTLIGLEAAHIITPDPLMIGMTLLNLNQNQNRSSIARRGSIVA